MNGFRRLASNQVYRSAWRSLAAVSVLVALSTPAAAMSRPVTVVELFTSQGCSSVPPANRNLMDLGQTPDLLPLSFSVTYWDDLGWKDTFGSEDFTKRQRDYEPRLGHDGPFTPQIVVNGSRDTVGNKMDALRAIVDAAQPSATVSIDIKDRAVEIGRGEIPASGADVWLVRYRPGVQSVAVERGENAGIKLPVANVVTDIQLIGHWLGDALSFPTEPAESGQRTAVLVQAPGGPILSAATN